MTTSLSIIWENTDGSAEQYICYSSVMLQCYFIIIDRGISAPGHVKEVLDVLNAVDKFYIYQCIYTVQIPGSIRFDLQIQIHTGTKKYDIILAKEFQEHMTKNHRKNGVIDQVNSKKAHGKKMDKQRVSCSV